MDVRIARTRAGLQDALLELARERPLDEITVADIADRAGVNRSTFYQHYDDKDSLLADAIDDVLSTAQPGLVDIQPHTAAPPERLLTLLRHIEHNAALYRMVLGDNGSAPVMARVRERIQAIVAEGVSKKNEPGFEGIPVEVIAAGIAGTAFGVVRAWLASDPRPSAEVAADWLWRLLAGTGGEQAGCGIAGA
jgi:AcrR family transcriptional regulator